MRFTAMISDLHFHSSTHEFWMKNLTNYPVGGSRKMPFYVMEILFHMWSQWSLTVVKAHTFFFFFFCNQ